MAPVPPAGWYVDPSSPHLIRYWDGVQWTASTQPRQFPAVAPGSYTNATPAQPPATYSIVGAPSERADRGAHRLADDRPWYRKKRALIWVGGLALIGAIATQGQDHKGDQGVAAPSLTAASTATSAPPSETSVETTDAEAPAETEGPGTAETDAGTSPDQSPAIEPTFTPPPVHTPVPTKTPVAPRTTRQPQPSAPKTTAPKTTQRAPLSTPRKTSVRPPSPTATAPRGFLGSAYYKNCDAVRAAGKAPLHRGDPGYRAGLDRDDDGVACE